jgi:hypothetical protein
MPLVISFVIVVLAWAFSWIGLSQLGICEFTSTSGTPTEYEFPIFQLAYGFFFAVFAVWTYRYFRAHMPQTSALNRRKWEESMLIARFTIGMSIIELLYSVANFVLFNNCQLYDPLPSMMVFATIFNLTRILEFCYLIAVMLLYPKIGKKVKKLFRSLITRKK